MITFRKVATIILGATAIGLAGCGGNEAATNYTPRGEGNIPIGCVPVKDMGECGVLIQYSNGSKYETMTRGQVVYSSVMPKGFTTVTVYPKSNLYAPEQVVFLAGAEQYHQFNARPSMRTYSNSPIEFDTKIKDGDRLLLGRTYDLGVMRTVPSFQNVQPTVVLSGGFGRLDEQDKITTTRRGTGQIIVDLLGTRKTINITVE